MRIAHVFVAVMALSLTASAVEAAPKAGRGASSFTPGSGGSGIVARNSAPGQQMLNNRTSATAPGKSFNAPGQRMIRKRTPGGTPTR